ncbi:MAG: hypothetical protein J7L43_00625 [Candidatus Aenigmarchaeota archaeon]|nr:hypothetical protein [Candidatus Aenigmarchaeota archaeon]
MRYEPQYAKGEILVAFSKSIDKDFARKFGEVLGYELSDDEYRHGYNIFIYKTSPGKEREAIEKFKSHSDFVMWAERRDIKLENRWNLLERVEKMINNLIDNAEIPDKEYESKIEELCEILRKSL